MHIANESTLKALSASIVEINNAMQMVNLAFSAFISSLEDSEWVGMDKASKLTGLTPRQLRYRAEQGHIKTRKEGRNYLFFTGDLMQMRNHDLA